MKSQLLFFGFWMLSIIGFSQDFSTIKLKTLDGKSTTIVSKNNPVAMVFYSPECPLCKNYTLTLNQLSEAYPEVRFVAVFSGKDYSKKEIIAFKEKYQIEFDMLLDKHYELAQSVDASVTPEAVLLDTNQAILYRGLIDNWAIKLGGSHRREVTEKYLKDAIEAVLKNQTPAISKTEPMGCLLYATE